MSVPKPHDPRSTAISPEQLTREVDDILAQPAQSLAEEAHLLGRVHEVLQEALQDN